MIDVRNGRVASLDMANVLGTSRLWRNAVERIVSEEFPDLTPEHVLIESAGLPLITNPARFGVVLTENMFGEITSDEASVLAGSIGALLGPQAWPPDLGGMATTAEVGVQIAGIIAQAALSVV